ncbi:hypothetical protein [Brevifollis gellanilyticus]|nr:hypothetical protein [Brevifollis gellanilyticus]
MKTETTARLAMRLIAMTVIAGALASCKLPPRYAMREIQSKGLFTYLGTDYSRGYYPGYYGGSAYASTNAPFQTQQPYTEPRAIRQVPYRSTYQTNRNLRADYDRVPYRPRTVERYTAPSRPRRSSPVIVDDEGPTPSPTPARNRSSGNKVPDKVVTDTPAPKSSTVTPAPVLPAVPAVEENLPFGTPVAGRPGMVVSPYTDPSKKQLVDVTGLPAGEKVKDPYSGKLFRVPPTSQADNKKNGNGSTETPAKPEGGADKDKAQPKEN